MDQAKLDVLTGAVLKAQRDLKMAAEAWEDAYARTASLPQAKTEQDLTKQISDALEPGACVADHELKRTIQNWARQKVERERAEKQRDDLNEKMKQLASNSHEALLRLVEYVHESLGT